MLYSHQYINFSSVPASCNSRWRAEVKSRYRTDLPYVNHKTCWKQKRNKGLKKGQSKERRTEESRKDWRIIPIRTKQDGTLHSLFYPETALHVPGGTTTHHQERKQLHLQHLVLVTPLLLPAAIMVWQIPDAVDAVVCAPDNGWWYHPKHVEQFPDKINSVTLHLVGYILEQKRF